MRTAAGVARVSDARAGDAVASDAVAQMDSFGSNQNGAWATNVSAQSW